MVVEVEEEFEAILNEVLSEGKQYTLGELRKALLEKVSSEYEGEKKKKLLLLVDLYYFSAILQRNPEMFRDLNEEELIDLVFIMFFNGFNKGVEEKDGKMTITIDFGELERIYGFKQEEVSEAINNWGEVRNDFYDYIMKIVEFINFSRGNVSLKDVEAKVFGLTPERVVQIKNETVDVAKERKPKTPEELKKLLVELADKEYFGDERELVLSIAVWYYAVRKCSENKCEDTIKALVDALYGGLDEETVKEHYGVGSVEEAKKFAERAVSIVSNGKSYEEVAELLAEEPFPVKVFGIAYIALKNFV